MFASRNPMSFASQWQRDRIQRAFEVEWQQCWRIKIPAVAGLVVLALLTVVLWSPLADATGDCRTSPLVFKPGETVETVMTVARDRACSLYVSPGSAVINALAVTVSPLAGSVSARGRTGIIYRSPAGLSHDDSFAFVLTSKVREDIAAMTVNVRINVR